MTEEEWLAGKYAAYPEALRLCLQSLATERKLRLCAVACCRAVWTWLSDERSRDAVEVAERHADRLAGDNELQQAGHQAYEAAVDARNGALNDSDLTARAFYATCSPGTAFSHALEKCSPSRGRTIVLEIFGNPFRPVTFDAACRTSAVVALATGIYEERVFDRMPILADALGDAGCDNADIIGHLRDPDATHVRGCWALDLVLGKE
jgi:hypothetical protein